MATHTQQWSGAHQSTQTWTLAVTPGAIGRVICLTFYNGDATHTIQSITGGGVSVWNFGYDYHDVPNTNDTWLYFGAVTAIGAQTISVTFATAAPAGGDIAADEFSTTVTNPAWTLVGANGNPTASSQVCTWPSLTTPGSAGDTVYYGQGILSHSDNGSNGQSPAGFSFRTTTDDNWITYGPSLSPSTAYAPTAQQTIAGFNVGVGMIIRADVGPTAQVGQYQTRVLGHGRGW
jgi:hypothetical protein